MAPRQCSRRSPALPQKPFDTSGKSPAHIHHPPILQNALWLIRRVTLMGNCPFSRNRSGRAGCGFPENRLQYPRSRRALFRPLVAWFEKRGGLIYKRPMHAVTYYLIALWAGVWLTLLMCNFYLWVQMKNHRVPKEGPMWEMNRAAFQTDPADYTETGQAYRRKATRVQVALLVWFVIGMIGLLNIFK
jgi:hypothetical protein